MPSVCFAGVLTLVLMAILLGCSSAVPEQGYANELPSQDEISKLPPDGGAEFNRLIHEKSPYLLQHARNPVNWYPWGDEAFARAKKEGKAVFLSIGYSTCHWCHVMERESFERQDVADILNEHFIAIKVDREERPDIDEIYMAATQLITNRGGWPNSLWLTPDGRPWYAGTYFPREDSFGRPGFKTILVELAGTWRTRREAVEAQADQLAAALKQFTNRGRVDVAAELNRELISSAADGLLGMFDRQHGGLVGAPKFPPHTDLTLLIYEYRRTKAASLLTMITATLDGMARGGIHDHAGGGFHRYATDAQWFLPHFEKMLYDNAQLSRAYVDGYLITGDENYRQVAIDTYEWVLRVMTDEGGGFYSGLDADSEGEEGKFYLWSRSEILEVLGKKEGERFCRVYGVEKRGNFRDEATGKKPGTNILHLKSSLAEVAESEGLPLEELTALLAKGRRQLLKRRNKRVWPHLDDKVLTSWTGLMIGSLAYGGQHLDEPRYIAAAQKAAEFVLANLYKDKRLLRTYREGEAKLNGYLEDYAFLADGLLDLYEANGDKRYVETAKALVKVLLLHFRDDSNGGFFFTSDDHEKLLSRGKDPFDKAIPSGNGIAARVLVRLGRLTGDKEYFEGASAIFDAFLGFMRQAPRGTESLIQAAGMYLDAVHLESPASTTSGETDKPDASVRKKPVTLEAFASRLKVAPGDSVHIAIRVSIDADWHINSNAPIQSYLIPTSVALAQTSSLSLGDAVYPEGTNVKLAFSDEELSVYDGTLWILVPLTVAQNAEDGPVEIALQVHTQACDDRICLRPETHALTIPIEVHRKASGAGKHKKIFEALGVL